MIGAAMIGRRPLAYSIGLFAILFSLTDDDRTIARLYAIEAVLWFILAAVIESKERTLPTRGARCPVWTAKPPAVDPRQTSLIPEVTR